MAREEGLGSDTYPSAATETTPEGRGGYSSRDENLKEEKKK